jgi:hypothetical protein
MKNEKQYDYAYQGSFGLQQQASCPVFAPKRLYEVTFENGDSEYVVANNIITAARQYECTDTDKGEIVDIAFFSKHVNVAN